MKLRNILYGVMLIALVVCGSITIYAFLDPQIPIPREVSTIFMANKLCASQFCQSSIEYDTTLTLAEVADFYKHRGFRCSVVQASDNNELLFGFSGTYTQCKGDTRPRGQAVLGIQQQPDDPQQSIHVLIRIFWEPIL